MTAACWPCSTCRWCFPLLTGSILTPWVQMMIKRQLVAAPKAWHMHRRMDSSGFPGGLRAAHYFRSGSAVQMLPRTFTHQQNTTTRQSHRDCSTLHGRQHTSRMQPMVVVACVFCYRGDCMLILTQLQCFAIRSACTEIPRLLMYELRHVNDSDTLGD